MAATLVDSFRAYRIDERDGRIVAGFEELTVDDLSDGNVLVKVSHSTINYKDALAATGSARILRRYPLNGGIDLAGSVVSSDDAAFQPGTPVLVNGCGLSETLDGGYSEYARVDSASLVPIPDNISPAEAMQIGTAGYTAALAIHRMEQNGQVPGDGPVVVTGATGGVGSIAIDMLDGRGYEVVAVTGKATEDAYLRAIGARPPDLADADHVLWRQYRVHRTRGEHGIGDHRAAVHPACRLPARHKFRRHAAEITPGRLVEDRDRSQAAPPRHDQSPHDPF